MRSDPCYLPLGRLGTADQGMHGRSEIYLDALEALDAEITRARDTAGAGSPRQAVP